MLFVNECSSRKADLFAAFIALFVLAVSSITLAPSVASADVDEPFDHQAERLFRAVLGRKADESGQQYWSDVLQAGYPTHQVARFLLDTPEAKQRSSGDPIVDAYKWALGRAPDKSGYDFWKLHDPAFSIAAIADSEEHWQLTKTAPPPHPVVPPRASAQDLLSSGWVDGGNGVMLPPVLLEIRRCESTNNYGAVNSSSGAAGAYQFLKSSWAAYGHNSRYGQSTADRATPAQQDDAVLRTWQESGTRPWNASRYCWS